jgi:DNA-binding Xre family transcriptional regulator
VIQDCIYQIMREKNMCQAAVARAAGFAPKELNDMLRGRKLIRPEYILPLCRGLDCTPNDLFKEARR